MSKTFKDFTSVKEAKDIVLNLGKGEKAVIKQEGSRFVAYVDGKKLDVFKSAEEAKKALNDLIKLMGK